jgi:uncharacterized membrane protein YtjA (UPF0391 family)
MFYWAIAFLVISLLAAIFGFGGLAADAAWLAKIVFVVALVVSAVTFVLSRGRRVT